MVPLKQLQQPALGAAGVQTPNAGVLYNVAHAATFEDISGNRTLPQSKLAMQSNAGTIPTEVDPSNGAIIPGDDSIQDNSLPDPMSQTT